MEWVWAYPVATVSAVAAYLACALILFMPLVRGHLLPVPQSTDYQPGFDAIRGFAAILVAVGHFGHFAYPVFSSTQQAHPFFNYTMAFAYKAVPIFCTLSGFLIYRTLEGVETKDGYRAYFTRRIFRIYPVYFLGVVLSLAFGLMRDGEGYKAAGLLLSELTLGHIIGFNASTNPVFWSIYIEIMFYVALPVLLLFVDRRRMVFFAIFAIAVLTTMDYETRDFGVWKYFFFGILASHLARHAQNRRVSYPLFTLGMGLLWVDFLGPQYDFVAKLQKIVPSGYMNQTLVLGVACMLILATVKNVKPVAWILEMPLFRLFGAVSFSLYVTHPYFILANFPAMQNLVLGSQQPFQHLQLHVMPWWYMPLVFLPGAVFFALIAHLLVEHPGIRLGRMLIRSWEQTPVSAKMRTAATNSTSDKWSGSGLERVKELR